MDLDACMRMWAAWKEQSDHEMRLDAVGEQNLTLPTFPGRGFFVFLFFSPLAPSINVTAAWTAARKVKEQAL